MNGSSSPANSRIEHPRGYRRRITAVIGSLPASFKMWPMPRSAVAISLFVVLQSPDEQLIRAVRGESNPAIAKHDLDGIAAA